MDVKLRVIGVKQLDEPIEGFIFSSRSYAHTLLPNMQLLLGVVY